MDRYGKILLIKDLTLFVRDKVIRTNNKMVI